MKLNFSNTLTLQKPSSARRARRRLRPSAFNLPLIRATHDTTTYINTGTSELTDQGQDYGGASLDLYESESYTKRNAFEAGTYRDEADGRHSAGFYFETSNSGSYQSMYSEYYYEYFDPDYGDEYVVDNWRDTSSSTLVFGSYGAGGSSQTEITIDKSEGSQSASHDQHGYEENIHVDYGPESWGNGVQISFSHYDDKTPAGGAGWLFKPTGVGGSSAAAPPDQSELAITEEMVRKWSAPLLQVAEIPGQNVAPKGPQVKPFGDFQFLRPDPAIISKYGGLNVVEIDINIDPTKLPSNFDISQVQQKMQEAVNKAGLSLFVVLKPFTPGQGEPEALGKHEQGKTGKFQWTQRVDFKVTPPLAATGGPALARTTDRVKTVINPDVGSLEPRRLGVSPELYYANILLHEAFWLGVLGRKDVKHGNTPLSSPELQKRLIEFTPEEIEAILGEFGIQFRK